LHSSNSRFILPLVVVFVLPATSCSARRGVGAASASADQAEANTAPTPVPRLDPQEFLCTLTGGPANPERVSPTSGRRYTPEERTQARALIASELQCLGLVASEHHYIWTAADRQWLSWEYLQSGYGNSGINLLAELPATIPSNQWVVMGAHYDTVDTSPGADDNASGVTAVLLAAEQLVTLETRRVNVLFAFFDQEEEGLIGSHALVRQIVADQRQVITAHIIDMVGWDTDDDRVVELAHCNMPAAANDVMMRLYEQAAIRLSRDNPNGLTANGIVRTESCRSDHVYFSENGIPAAQLGEEFSGNDVTPYYHRPQDTCDTLDYDFLRVVAALVVEAVTEQLR